jgi:hypothetical protein
MNPSNITLESVTKLFEYEKISREIDTCNDVEILKNIAKSYVKLYFYQQEVISSLGIV